MKAAALLVLCALAAPLARAGPTPVQKVIELMEGMLAKGKQDKHDEQVNHAAFKQFCDDTATETSRNIKEAEEKVATLKADIEEYKAEAARLQKEADLLDGDVAAWTGDEKAATKVRDMEKAAYDELHQDYSESVDALGRAIQVLKAKAHDIDQASMVQVSALLQDQKLIPDDARSAIGAFLQADPVMPDAAGYEFHAHGIIEMLEKLLDKFQGERTSIENKERTDVHEYELLMKDLAAEIARATERLGVIVPARAKLLEDAAAAQGEMEETMQVRDEDKKYLADLRATCSQKDSQFAARQELRAEEIAAVTKAMEIIKSEAVKDSAEKHLPSLAQAAGHSLAALRSDTLGSDARTQKQVASFLRRQASKTGSRVLALVATRVEADPFAKVKSMIKDLITRLEEEASDEAEHKTWCDAELSTNEQTRKEKTAQVETLHANVDELTTSIAKLGEELDKLAQAIADIVKAMAEATELRSTEKAKNEATIADSKAAQEAVARALVVLKEFYAKAAEATALVQQKQNPEIPEMYKETYHGMTGESGGVVGMLEVIESDFARLEADTTAAEVSSQKEYDEFIADSKADKAAKEKDVESKNFKKQDESQALVVNKKNLEGTQKELTAALEYFDKLKPSCVEVGVSYDDRVERRKEEIESLQQALKILSGEEIAL